VYGRALGSVETAGCDGFGERKRCDQADELSEVVAFGWGRSALVAAAPRSLLRRELAVQGRHGQVLGGPGRRGAPVGGPRVRRACVRGPAGGMSPCDWAWGTLGRWRKDGCASGDPVASRAEHRGADAPDRRDGEYMDRQRHLILVACGICLAASCGCMRSWWNSFLRPGEVGRFHSKPVTNEIRATLGLQDEEVAFMNATEPLPEDTVAVMEEYQIGPADIVEVTIHELLRVGSITTEVRRVSDLGYVSLPVLGRVNIGGMTERQAEDLIKANLKEVELLSDPIVSVVVRTPTQRRFSVIGYAARAGPLSIPRSDFRMLEAISYVGSIPMEVEKVYVIRKVASPSQRAGQPTTAPSSEPGGPTSVRPAPSPGTTKSGTDGGLQEDVDLLLNELADTGGQTDRVGPAKRTSASRPAADPGALTAEERRELLKVIVPGGDASSGAGSSTPGATTSGSGPKSAPQGESKELSKWIWLNGDWVEVRGTTTTPAEPPATPATQPVRGPTTLDWEAVAEDTEQTRVIAIPRKALEAGEDRYNIVIRPGDVISVPHPEAGQRYYLMGHVRGPGAYAIPIRGITLKAAIAAAGGLDPWAWPSRCEIVRKIGPDQEETYPIDLDRIFAIEDAGIKIKPGDIINVGTHPLAPFIATIANGFRTTYGFGFVYDRNFGTIDSYAGQPNPTARRRAEKQARFGSLQALFPGL